MQGLTVEELRCFLSQQFSAYVRDPQIYIRPVAYRPIRVYVGGEVKRPGYYTLSGIQSVQENVTQSTLVTVDRGSTALGEQVTSTRSSMAGGSSSATFFQLSSTQSALQKVSRPIHNSAMFRLPVSALRGSVVAASAPILISSP